MSLLAIAIYGIATVIFLILGFIIVYHLIKYGFIGDATKFMVIIFIIVSALLILTSSVYVMRTDWQSLSPDAQGSQAIPSNKPILGY